MIVKSNDVFEVPDVDAPIVVEVVHTGVDVVGTCMVACSCTFLCFFFFLMIVLIRPFISGPMIQITRA
jgi:hypothetical protein